MKLSFRISGNILRSRGLWVSWRRLGIWSKHESKVQRLKRLIKNTFCLELFIVMQFAYFFDYDSNEDLAFALCQFPSCLGIFLKAVNFCLKKPEIEEHMTMAKELHDRFPLKPSLLRRLSVASRVAKFRFASLTAAVISLVIGSAYHLPMRCWTPFDVENSRIEYWITVFLQFMGLVLFFFRNSNLKWLFVILSD